ncbi:MAG: Rieske (2Fe-2S) protein [Bacteroidetes bacterium]|nr:Rieske (2Fe-2S) protein [Fibrella sp.]
MENQQASGVIKRGEFLRELGLSSSALMAFYCLGTLSSCSSSDPQPATTPPTGTTPPPTTPPAATGLTGNAQTSQGKISFALDLTSATYAGLKTVGGFVVVGDVIVANARGSRLIALSKACTHAGTTVEYQAGPDNFYCSNHGSRFSLSGSVLNGPAGSALRMYTATLSTNGNSIAVAE